MNEKLCDILLFVFMSSVSLLSCLYLQCEHIPTVQSFSTILQFRQLSRTSQVPQPTQSRTCNLRRKERSFGAALLCWLFLYINNWCPRFKLLELSYNVYAFMIITLLILKWLHNMVWVGRGEDPYYSAHPGFKISTPPIFNLETAQSLPSAQSMLIGNYYISGNVNKNIKKVTKGGKMGSKSS